MERKIKNPLSLRAYNMTPRSLINLILKILGIFFIKDILEAFSHLLSVVVYFPQYASEKEAYYNLGVAIPSLVLYSLFSWMLIFRTNTIIDLFRLDRNLGTDITPIQVNRSVILSTSLIIIGGWTVVNELPELFRHAVYYYQERKIYVRMARPDISYALMSALKVFIGLVLIVFNRGIVNVLERFQKK
jgi:hypothetical protein